MIVIRLFQIIIVIFFNNFCPRILALSSSEAGLAISSAMALTGMFQWGVRQSAEVENQMTSVERVIEYSRLPSEAPLDSKPGIGKIINFILNYFLFNAHYFPDYVFVFLGKKPPPTWPLEGNIKFDKMFLRYTEADQPVLKNICCVIEAREKVNSVTCQYWNIKNKYSFNSGWNCRSNWSRKIFPYCCSVSFSGT